MAEAQISHGYKQTEAGVIPEDWEVGSLSRFWTVTDCKHVTAQFVDNGFPIASIKEVQSRFVDLKNAKQTTQQFYNLLIEGGRKPRVGDLILSRNATVGEVAQVAEWHSPFAMGQDVCLLRKKSPEFSTNYLQAVFRSPIIANQLSDLMVGSTFKRANVQQIKNLTVPMPPPAEQEAIAEALSDADALIESLEQFIAKKRQIKQGAMQELLTGKNRLPGFIQGKQGYCPTKFGMIPVDWVPTSLEQISGFITKGSTPTTYGFAWQHEGVLFLRSECVSERGLDLSQSMFISGEAHQVLRRSEVRAGDILMTITGNVGRVVHLQEGFGEANINQHIARIRIVHEEVAAPFVFHFLSQPMVRRYYNLITTGQAYPQISLTQVRETEVPMPSLAEQTAIATILSDMDAEIAALEAKLAKARQLKHGMMQELLTGKTRLVESEK
jgi:type I restriction enzyme, S subunit